MQTKKKFLLLVGSPRNEKSTSYSLGKYLIDRLKTKGHQTECIFLYQLHSDEDLFRLLLQLNEYNMIIVSAPLYVDCLPAHVIRVFEFLYQHKEKISKNNIHISVIVNCGFPESNHNTTALTIYKYFSDQMGFMWSGFLSLGMGGFINGRNLKSLGGRVSQIQDGLSCAAEDLLTESMISEEAQEFFDKKIIPHWLYRAGGNIGWNIQARKNNVSKKELLNTPHLQ